LRELPSIEPTPAGGAAEANSPWGAVLAAGAAAGAAVAAAAAAAAAAAKGLGVATGAAAKRPVLGAGFFSLLAW
jgi:hypothetical protein